MFDIEDPKEANRHAISNLYHVKDYGSSLGRNSLHTGDSGERYLMKCKKCGCYVLVQESECWSLDKDYYDYIPVNSIEHADELNKLYDGYEIEYMYKEKILLISNENVYWNK